MSDQYLYVIDCGEGPFNDFEAAKFHAAETINKFASGKVGEAFTGKPRKATICKVMEVIDPVPPWKKFFLGGAA